MSDARLNVWARLKQLVSNNLPTHCNLIYPFASLLQFLNSFTAQMPHYFAYSLQFSNQIKILSDGHLA